MNKQNGNMYGFITHTWNPLAGKCMHDCTYCSTNKLRRYPVIDDKYSGQPRIDEKIINENLGSNNFIFVCAQNDLFANDVPHEIRARIINCCHSYYGNKYLFQTKNPVRMQGFIFPPKSTLCITLESDINHGNSIAPGPLERIYEFSLLPYNKMITIEPIMDFDLFKFMAMILEVAPIQVNIGADSGNNNLKEPSAKKIKELIELIENHDIKVFQKDNLKRLLK